MGMAELRCSFCRRPISPDLVAGAAANIRCPWCGDKLTVERYHRRRLAAWIGLAASAAMVAAVVFRAGPADYQTPPSQAGTIVMASDDAAAPVADLAVARPISSPITPALPVNLAASAGPEKGEKSSRPSESEFDLCYRWKENEHYGYRVACKVGSDDTATELVSTNTYRVIQMPDAGAKPDPRDARLGSGTAFVVSPDGYLLTCAHVVRNATDIKVTLGNETLPCEEVIRDDRHDLAVLRVARKNLPSLPLGDSDTVELAQEVRAVGFPLSDVLGSSLKVTQGTIAGISAGRRGKVFQIDALVNPGNSGGPLVDSTGCVIGVVNAQLVGMRISEVGFAVPINYAKSLLVQRKIAFQTAAGRAKLDGPAVARQVAPAVGLVTMMCHGDESDGQKKIVLKYHAIVEQHGGNRGQTAPFPGTPEQRDDGKLVIGELGEIFESDARVRLPGLLGSLATVLIDPLPDGNQTTWQHEEIWALTASSHEQHEGLGGVGPGFRGPRGPFGPRRGFPGLFGPFASEPEPKSYLAIRRTTFRLEEPQGETVVIHKHLDLRTLEKVNDKPAVELIADGETLFDWKLGIPRKASLSGTLSFREGSRQFPVSLTFERTPLTSAAVSAAAAVPVPSAEPPVPPAEPPEKRLDRLLADLRAPERDWSKCFQALERLGMMPVIESRRDEVAEALDPYLREKNYSARSSALRAASAWGTKRNAPAIAEMLKSSAERARAVRVLRNLGPAAENAVLSLLAVEDVDVRVEACKLLSEIGSAENLAALQERLSKDDAEPVQTAAKAAIEKIRARK